MILQILKGVKMKLKPEWRVYLEHVPSGKKCSLALIPQPFANRYWLRYNGKKSEKLPECTKTLFLKKIGEIFQSL